MNKSKETEFEKELNGWAKTLLVINKLQMRVFIPLFFLVNIWIFRAPLITMLDNAINPRIGMEDDVAKNILVDNLLDWYLDMTGADRVYLMIFHNGNRYYTNAHINKMDMKYERTSKGIARIAHKHQDVQTSLYTDVLHLTFQDKFRYERVEDIEDLMVREAYINNGVKSTICIPIRYGGEVIAIIGIDWIKKSVDAYTILHNFGMETWDSDGLYGVLMSRASKIGKYL
tara:strand:+ start:9022 stop:9708 length:687 start_codon:yes stop_codon:yes gene_type:complete